MKYSDGLRGLGQVRRSGGLLARPAATACAVVTVLGLAAAACGSGSSSTSAAQSAPKTLQNVSVVTTSAGLTSVMLTTAQQLGFFKKAGLNVTVSQLTSSLAVSAVASGKINYDSAAGPTVDGATLAGQPVKTYAALTQKQSFVLAARPEIKTLADLSGKTVAGQGTTAINTVFLTELLRQKGLLSSVNIVHLNSGSSGTIALMESGKAEAAVIDYGAFLEMPAGYHILYNYFDSKSTFYAIAGGIVANPAYVATHKQQVKNIIAALMNAKNYFSTHKAKVLPIIEKNFNLDAAKATLYWKAANSVFTVNGKPSATAIKFEQSLDKTTLGISTAPPTKKLYDWSLLPPAGK